MKKYDAEYVKKVCSDSISMAQAAATLGMHFNTFRSIAKKLDCYVPNMGLKGGKRGRKANRLKTEDILNGKYPSYHTYKLRNRLIDEGLLDYTCAICSLFAWNGQPISLELDHIDGNKSNHHLPNLRLLCPNCHSQTKTFRNKKRT